MQPLLICLLAAVSYVSAYNGNALSGDEVNCYVPQDVGTCTGQEEAWHYNKAAGRCTFFVYSGCGGNTNRFASRQKCEEACGENYCPDLDCPASCNTALDQNGCEVCSCTKEQAAVVCKEPQKGGYCRALHHKWAWSQEEGKCVEFVYGGCGGNENSFDSKMTCMRVCGGAFS